MRHLILAAMTAVLMAIPCGASVTTSDEALPLPTPQQAEWQRRERIMFVHFGPATFQHREYDNLTGNPAEMYMSRLDTDQWCQTAQAWGANMIIFVAKHTGGFCWWQTATSDYGVRQTPWRGGSGDVMSDLSASCRKYGLDLGVYCYPGDEQWGAGIGSGGVTADPAKQAAYNEVYRRQLTELLSRYGDIKEVWFDGNCHIPVADIVAEYAPDAVVFQGECASIRWVGNEDGFAPDPNWYTLSAEDLATGVATSVHSDAAGEAYAPVEVDVPLLKNGGHKWFWAPESDSLLLTTDQLMEMYFNSVGRGAVLLLNSTPDTTGLIPASHVARYREFGRRIHEYFDNPVGSTAGDSTALELTFETPTEVNCVMIQEVVEKGQRIRAYHLEGTSDGREWTILAKGTSVGHKKIDRFPTRRLTGLRLVIDSCRALPAIENFSAFRLPEEALATTTRSDAPVTIGVWESNTWSADQWTDAEFDLTPFMTAVGQYELEFCPTGHDYNDPRPWGIEVESAELTMYGAAANEHLERQGETNRWIITRSQQTLDDFPTRLKLRLRSRPGKSIGEIRLRKIAF